jgi:hypothetical protein
MDTAMVLGENQGRKERKKASMMWIEIIGGAQVVILI